MTQLATLQERRSTLESQRAALAEQHATAIDKVSTAPSQKTIAAASALTTDKSVLDQAVATLDAQIDQALAAEQQAAEQAAQQAVITEAQALAAQMRECREVHDEALINLTVLLGRELHRLADIRTRWRATADRWRVFTEQHLPTNTLRSKYTLHTNDAGDQAILDQLAAAGVDVPSLLTQIEPWGWLETDYRAPIKGTPRNERSTAETMPADAALDMMQRADWLAKARPE